MTTILKKHGEDGIAAWRERVGDKQANYISSRASEFGTSLHEMAEQYILGQDIDKTNHEVYSRFKDVKRIIDEDIGDVYALETALYSDYLKLAGRTDVIGQFRGIPSIIDFKTAAKPKKMEWIESYWLQTAGYAIMWSERVADPELRPKQLALIISVRHDIPQVFTQPILPWALKLREFLKLHHKDFK